MSEQPEQPTAKTAEECMKLLKDDVIHSCKLCGYPTYYKAVHVYVDDAFRYGQQSRDAEVSQLRAELKGTNEAAERTAEQLSEANEEAKNLRAENAKLMERIDKLEKALMRQVETYISAVSHIESPNHVQVDIPGNYIHLIKIMDTCQVSVFKKVESDIGNADEYPCKEWREFNYKYDKLPLIPFKDFEECTKAIEQLRKRGLSILKGE